MATPNKLRALEKKLERPIEQVLVELYGTLGSQRKVAQALGVTQGTVSMWLRKVGLVQRVILVKKCEDKAS